MTGAIKVVFLKELLENVRDRRVILSAFFFGVLLAPLVFGLSTTLASKRFMKNQDQALELAVSGAKLAQTRMLGGTFRCSLCSSDTTVPVEARRRPSGCHVGDQFCPSRVICSVVPRSKSYT